MFLAYMNPVSSLLDDFASSVQSSGDYLAAIYDYLVNLAKALRNALLFITDSFPFVFQVISYLPSIIGAGVIAFLTVGLLKFLMGRL